MENLDSSMKPISVIILNSKKDTDAAIKLHRVLLQSGMKAWLPEIDLLPGDSIVESINNEFQKADICVAILSSGFVNDKWLKYELEEIQRISSLQTLFVCFDDIELIPSDFSKHQYISAEQSQFPFETVVTEIKKRFPHRAINLPSFPPFLGDAHRHTKLFGRETELSRLKEIAQSQQFIAIVGLGGVGKTLLASAFAKWTLGSALVEQVLWVSGDYSNPNDTLIEIAHRLGLPEELASAPSKFVDNLKSSLQNRSALLVVDEATEAVMQLLYQILPVIPQNKLRVLTTSRSIPSFMVNRDYAIVFLEFLTRDQTIELTRFILKNSSLAEYSETSDLVVRLAEVSQGNPLSLKLLIGNLETQFEQKGTIYPALFEDIAIDVSHVPNEDRTTHDNIKSLFLILQNTFEELTQSQRDLLQSIALLGQCPVTVRTIATLHGTGDTVGISNQLSKLSKYGLIQFNNDQILIHPIVREFCKEKKSQHPSEPQEILYITIDPELVSKEDFVELLDALNTIYVQLGGDELIIREDEVGKFSKKGVFV